MLNCVQGEEVNGHLGSRERHTSHRVQGLVGRAEEGGAAGSSRSWKPKAVTSRD